MDNLTFKKAKQLSRDAGVSLMELCRRADVNYRTVANWKRKEPMQFCIMRKLTEAADVIGEKQKYSVTVRTDVAERTHKVEANDYDHADELMRSYYDTVFKDEVVSTVDVNDA
ncbi:MAG TPA: hypothetical protein VKP88_08080 [Candidatus Paceibacterota bacterium]|nr:hypothetical protein [Candidatus Paceibacterota bacterium]